MSDLIHARLTDMPAPPSSAEYGPLHRWRPPAKPLSSAKDPEACSLEAAIAVPPSIPAI